LATGSPPAEWSLLPIRQNNLPIPPTPLFGREGELAALNRLIAQPDCHLLSLIGPGGVGKTRLALAAATASRDAFTQGVFFVPLAPLTMPEFIVPAIADALHFSPSGASKPEAQLLNYLRDKQVLLVLDNLEHLLSDIHVLAEILHSAPNVKLLATSRERLNVQGEWVYDMQGLPAPSIGSAAGIEENSAVILFTYAAQHQRFGFSLTEDNRQAVARICQLVDGMPLGIELAAAWTHVLTCQEIADRIEASLDFLTVPARDRPERHQSMRAVIDHSWRFLSPQEQLTLCQLSVFRGGFGHAAAEHVAEASLSILSALIDKSLIHRTRTDRYDLHELVRQYSAIKLADADGETAARQKHFDFYLSLVESAEPHLTSADWNRWLNYLEAEQDNLRTALAWSQVQIEKGESMLRLSGGLYWYWFHRNDLSEGRAWLESALVRAGDSVDPITRARALYGAGSLAHMQGDNSLARSPLEESVALWRATGVPGKHGLAYGLIALGWLARDEGDLGTACSLLTESIELLKEQDDQWGLAFALKSLGMVYRDESDFTKARSLMEASIVLWRSLGDEWGLADALHYLGLVALRQGDYVTAHDHMEEALTLYQQIRYRHGFAYALLNLGLIALNQGNLERSEPYFKQAHPLFRELGNKFGIASTLHYFGYLAMLEGNDSRAQYLIEQSLALAGEGGHRWLSALCVARLAGVVASRGQTTQAVQLWSAADSLMAGSASYMDKADQIYYERTIAPACKKFDEATLEAARIEGWALSLDDAISLALRLVQEES
jgi:predicted ATPase